MTRKNTKPQIVRKLVIFSDICSSTAMLEQIKDLLSRKPKPMGWTIGIDSGDLIKLEMNEQVEYVGKAPDVAARLQGAAKQFMKDYGLVVSSRKARMRK